MTSILPAAANPYYSFSQPARALPLAANTGIEPAALQPVKPAQPAGQDISTATAGTQAQLIAQSENPEATAALLEGNSIITRYDNWRATLPIRNLSPDYLARLNDTRDTYISVLEKAERSGTDPQAFLKTLTPQELAALQHHNSLADPINPAALSEEGAYNLLRLPSEKTDLNRDGLLTTGIGNAIVFPPTDAPQNVLDAWKAASKDMDWGTRMTMQLSMWINANGGFDIKEGATAPYYAEDFSWQNLARTMVDGTRENLKYQETAQQKAFAQRMLEGYEDFLKYLMA